MGLPDMKLPIQYALTYPKRIKNNFARFSFADFPYLTFEQPDLKTFRNLALAFAALDTGGNMPCIVNAANEIAVAGFLKEQVTFLGMSDLIEECTQRIRLHKKPGLEDYLNTDLETRVLAQNLLLKKGA